MTADMVNHPPHYNSHPSGVECITITEHFNFLLGSAIKYIWRADDKGNPIQDLEKAVWYVQRELGRRRLLEIEADHDHLPTIDPHAWPGLMWTPPEQVYDLYGGNGAPFPVHLPDPDDDAPDFD